MGSFNTPFSLEQLPSLPWGTLEAIEVPDYPQTHLRVARPEHREALAALVGAELGEPTALTPQDANPNGWSVSLEEEDGTESLIFSLHEEAWGQDGMMVGCLGLWRTEAERSAQRARIGACITRGLEIKRLSNAVYCLLAHGQETWGWSELSRVTWAPIAPNSASRTSPAQLPDLRALPFEARGPIAPGAANKVLNVKALMLNVSEQWEGAKRFYSSDSGSLSSEWYNGHDLLQDQESDLHKALSRDMKLCEEGVIVNGLHYIGELRSFIMPYLPKAIERAVPVTVSLDAADLHFPYADKGEYQAIVPQLKSMGVRLEPQPNRDAYGNWIIIDRRIFWEPAQGLPHGYITRTRAERQIPLPIIRGRRII